MMDFKPISELTYAQSVSELESILRMMQSDTCDIDLFGAYTGGVTVLVKACRTGVSTTEEELRDILASLGNEVARNS